VYAQETSPGPGTVEVTLIPGDAMYFTGGNDTSSFGTYTNRIVAIEGDVGSSFSPLDQLQCAGVLGLDARCGHGAYGAVIINAIR
jgi:hypothetical protein